VTRGPQRNRMPPPTELAIHFAVADLLRRCARRDWLYTHFPAGEYRPDETGAKLQRMGLKRGWPDFLFISPQGRLYCLELKSKSGVLDEDQRAFSRVMRSCALAYEVARSVDEAIRILHAWGVVPVTVSEAVA
jgi:hypothetical protein